MRLLFDEELEAKVINGRKLGGKELQTYFEVRVMIYLYAMVCFASDTGVLSCRTLFVAMGTSVRCRSYADFHATVNIIPTVLLTLFTTTTLPPLPPFTLGVREDVPGGAEELPQGHDHARRHRRYVCIVSVFVILF